MSEDVRSEIDEPFGGGKWYTGDDEEFKSIESKEDNQDD